MGLNFGRQTNDTSVALVGPASSTDYDLASGTAKVFKSPSGKPLQKVLIQNLNDSGINLKVKWNATTVAASGATGFDEEIAPGEIRESWYPGLIVERVALIADGVATNGTHFTIKGWY